MKAYLIFSALITCTLIGGCKKDNTINPELVSGSTVTDIDGNLYHSVIIGTQTWMVENLYTTKYRDGSSIPMNNNSWANLNTDAYCNYNSTTDINQIKTYGSLYNWYAINSQHNIAPIGWHIPTDADWNVLIAYLGGVDIAGGKMKEIGTSHWNSPNSEASNISGFCALPAGYYYEEFGYRGMFCGYWSSTEQTADEASCYTLHSDTQSLDKFNNGKNLGFSVRCIKDADNAK